jgi:4-nitrophenyl phosphatase
MKHGLVIFDLDGTLFRGDEPTPGAVETVGALRDSGVLVRYLTNNSSKTRGFLTAKLARLGFSVSEDEVFSSAIGAASYLHGQVDSVFVVGEEGLREAFGAEGIRLDGPPQAVVVGICRSFTYALMNEAMQHLLDPAVRFVATNTDATYPLEEGRLEPGAGSIVAAIAACSGRAPEVVGKPNPFLIDLILSQAGVSPRDCLVVGDRLETDIEAGRRAGCDTHLVLTGVTSVAPEGQAFSQDLRGILS